MNDKLDTKEYNYYLNILNYETGKERNVSDVFINLRIFLFEIIMKLQQ